MYSKGFLEFLTPLTRQKLLDPSNHELTPPSWLRKKRPRHYYALADSATFSVSSHAHDQNIQETIFILSQKLARQFFSKRICHIKFGQIFSYRRANKNCHTKIATENVLVWMRLKSISSILVFPKICFCSLVPENPWGGGGVSLQSAKINNLKLSKIHRHDGMRR